MVKEYHQYCPMSYALDIIGDRWALHIVRDLMFGPLRYKDIKKGLPTIASNLLSKRLKELEQVGVLVQKQLPPPASVTVYELTERGMSLHKVIGALVEWGSDYLQSIPPEEDFVSYAPFKGYLMQYFSPEKAKSISVTCEMHVDDLIFNVVIENRILQIAPPNSGDVNIVLYINDLRVFVGILNQAIALDDALENQAIALSDRSQLDSLRQFISIFDHVSD